MTFPRLLAAAALLAASYSAAQADTFGFTYTQGSADGFAIAVSGTLTADATPTFGQFQITGVTGTEVFSTVGVQTGTNNITGLLSPDTAYGADNLLYTGGVVPYLDTSGFTFTTDGNGSDFAGDVNIYYFTTNSVYNTPYEGLVQNGDFEVTDVPEPTSMVLGLSFLGMAFATRRAQGKA